MKLFRIFLLAKENQRVLWLYWLHLAQQKLKNNGDKTCVFSSLLLFVVFLLRVDIPDVGFGGFAGSNIFNYRHSR